MKLKINILDISEVFFSPVCIHGTYARKPLENINKSGVLISKPKIPLPHPPKPSSLPQATHPPPQHAISQQNRQHNADPLALVADAVSVQRQHAAAVDLAIGGKRGGVHALAARAARVGAVAEFVDHHAAKDVGLLWGEGERWLIWILWW